MNKDLVAIFEYLEREKGIKREIVLHAIEEALVAAAKKSINSTGNVNVSIDSKTGDIDVYVQKSIVDKVSNSDVEISLLAAQEMVENAELGQLLEISVTPKDFGRIAAQTARQIITQKLRGAERDVIYSEYRDRIGELISGTIKRFIRGRTIIVDLGKVEAIMPDRLYPMTERYSIGERVQAFLLEVRDTDIGGAEVILSRSAPEFVAKLFEQEVPELGDGTVIIEKIVRDAGYRTKLAVSSTDKKVDPIGTCVGVRGTRIKNIIREINNEKIDVFPYSDDQLELLRNALAPIEPQRINIGEEKVTIIVNDDNYAAVIGKRGMNARLLGKLLGREVQTQKISEYERFMTVQMLELAETDDPSLDASINEVKELNNLQKQSLISAEYDTIKKVLQASAADIISSVPGVNYLDLAERVIKHVKQNK
jgi:transcription termination/antitermination protein NusA